MNIPQRSLHLCPKEFSKYMSRPPAVVCSASSQHRLHHQPAAAPALRARLSRVSPLLLSPKVYQLLIRALRRPTLCFHPLKVMVFSQFTCWYFRAYPVIEDFSRYNCLNSVGAKRRRVFFAWDIYVPGGSIFCTCRVFLAVHHETFRRRRVFYIIPGMYHVFSSYLRFLRTCS